MKLFEYMSAEKAIVASSVGQINDIIKDGINGCLYDLNCIDELTKKYYC